MPDDILSGLREAFAPHNGHARDPDVVAKRFGLGPGKRKLSPRQWGKVNDAISSWRRRVLASAANMPADAFNEGHGQTARFLRLLGAKEHATPQPDRATAQWLQWILDHELTGTLDRYTDEIRSAVLYGLEQSSNPTAVASALYHATEKADRDWRRVAQTEMARANALGRLEGSMQMGYGEVWVPPHLGSCALCKTTIENKVFPAEQLMQASNFGRKQSEWVPCVPLHPFCRHGVLPWIPEVYEEAQQQHANLREQGLDDETLNEMFDSSGQLRPQYEGDPRLAAYFAGKTISDPFVFALGEAVEKVRSVGHISKGFFDPPQVGLDPLIWDGERLKVDVRMAILDFWTGVLGEGWQDWARVYITGSAASYQWGTGWHHPWLGSHQIETFPDVDTHLVIDYEKVRQARPMWAGMSPLELRTLLEAWALKAKENVEVAPGLRLDAYIRTEWSSGEFEADVSHTGQGVYDVLANTWLQKPPNPASGEYVGRQMLAGIGGRVAEENPDWITYADEVSGELQRALDAYQVAPGDATLADLQGIMDRLYEDRKAAFLEGKGQEDRGNWVWQYLSNFGPLLDVKALLHELAE